MASTTKVNPVFLIVLVMGVACGYEVPYYPFNLCSPLRYGSDGNPWGQWIETVLQDLLTTTPTYNGLNYGTSNNRIYGRATCSAEDGCSSCLSTAVDWIKSTCSSSRYGATATYPNCNVEYETCPI